MDATTMRADLSALNGPFPRAAMEWARAHRDDAVPTLLSMLTVCARPGDLSDREASGAFFALPLLAEFAEGRAFATLCALARNGDRLDHILGDFGAENLHRLLVALCADDVATVRAVATDPTVEPLVRASFVGAWATLALRTGGGATAFDGLVALRDSLHGAGADILPYDVAQALIATDVGRAGPVIDRAFARGTLDGAFRAPDDYARDLAMWREDPTGMRDTFLLENGPIADTVSFMEEWLERVGNEEAARARDEAEGDDTDLAPMTNPFREVGRNDPCPCGSGRKFKKCCLPTIGEDGAPAAQV